MHTHTCTPSHVYGMCVAEQETLIAGFQRENERLSDALRAAREGQRAEAAKGEEEARRLSLRLSELQV